MERKKFEAVKVETFFLMEIADKDFSHSAFCFGFVGFEDLVQDTNPVFLTLAWINPLYYG